MIGTDRYAADREALIRQIEAQFRETARYTALPELDERVREALRSVPRHLFVPAHERDVAYADVPLPIGRGQTISQPYIVALMSSLLDITPGDRVLEIGTGCGYQAAVLAALGAEVYSLEIIAELAERSARLLAELDYDEVTVAHGDGHAGWPEHAPYQGIVVTAAAPEPPPALLEQLAAGGRLVIPVGPRAGGQMLRCIRRRADGGYSERDVLPVAFVPFTRDRDQPGPACA
ncbi:MAG: protein-L-isoaspartate(D-aspartate) O-methyltransferase [Gammaproteobacteria bacterium]|nr:protein-L-isoaspartate(D-aspartate) O-methyltransferase [Gammaproteobacteria bacterium]